MIEVSLEGVRVNLDGDWMIIGLVADSDFVGSLLADDLIGGDKTRQVAKLAKRRLLR